MRGWETDWNRDVLERIVAMLFALAGLADLAAYAPFLRRRQVLGILSVAEVEARAFVVRSVPGAPVPPDESVLAGGAACLAASFRALALLLSIMLGRSGRSAVPRPAGPRAGRERHARRTGCQAAAAPDTS